MFSNLDPGETVFLITRHDGERVNEVISRIKIDWTRITQTVQIKQHRYVGDNKKRYHPDSCKAD